MTLKISSEKKRTILKKEYFIYSAINMKYTSISMTHKGLPTEDQSLLLESQLRITAFTKRCRNDKKSFTYNTVLQYFVNTCRWCFSSDPMLFMPTMLNQEFSCFASNFTIHQITESWKSQQFWISPWFGQNSLERFNQSSSLEKLHGSVSYLGVSSVQSPGTVEMRDKTVHSREMFLIMYNVHRF
jgi:hypothetical protein